MVDMVYGPCEMPWWLAQKFPEEISQHDPYVLYSDWGGIGQDGATHLSYWANEPSFAYAARFTQEIYQRFRAVAGDRLAAAAPMFGRPGAEAGMHHLAWDFLDYSPAAQRGLRTWLRDVQGYKPGATRGALVWRREEIHLLGAGDHPSVFFVFWRIRRD